MKTILHSIKKKKQTIRWIMIGCWAVIAIIAAWLLIDALASAKQDKRWCILYSLLITAAVINIISLLIRIKSNKKHPEQ